VSWDYHFMKNLLFIFISSCFLNSFAFSQQAFIYDNNDTASQIRLDLLRRESSSIKGNFYILKETTGLIHAALIAQALNRGVEVKIITDWIGTRVNRPLISHLVHLGAQVKIFNRISIGNLSIKRALRRMHDKLLIFGSDKLIVGDRNSGDGYFNMQTTDLFISREIYLEDAAEVKKANDYFEKTWSSREVSQLNKYLAPENKKVIEQKDKLAVILEDLKNGRMARYVSSNKFRNVRWNSKIDWSKLTSSFSKVEFVHDPVGYKGQKPGSEIDILKLINSATESIVIENPYVVLTPIFLKAFAQAINRGVSLTLITNSYKANDVKIAAKAYDVDFSKLAEMGMKIYEYKGPETLHTKNVLVDSSRGYIGSYNLDPRSENLNTEVGLIYHSKTLGQKHSNQIRKDIFKSTLVAKDGKALVKKKDRWFFRLFILPMIRQQL
jgi:cardiolipin synthase C